MFAAIFFAFVLATAHAAELPSYINVCGRKNPNLDQCIIDNINNLKERICSGLTELNLPKPEPLDIDKLVISETDNNKISLNNVQITGLCDYQINSFHADLEKLHFNIDASFKRLYLNGTYDVDVHILVPLASKAPIYLTSDNGNAKASLQVEPVTKKGKKYIYGSELKTNIDIKGYEAKYGLSEDELGQLDQILGGLIGSNQEEFIQRLIPPLEEAISKWLLTIFNGLFKKFSYDELFPDRE